MTPKEAVQALRKIGIPMTDRTLLSYQQQGLIPNPKRGAYGGGGRWTDYPDEVVEEAYAAYVMLHGKYYDEGVAELLAQKPFPLSVQSLVKIREHALELQEEEDFYQRESDVFHGENDPKVPDVPDSNYDNLDELPPMTAEERAHEKAFEKKFYAAKLLLEAFSIIWNNERKKAQILKQTP